MKETCGFVGSGQVLCISLKLDFLIYGSYCYAKCCVLISDLQDTVARVVNNTFEKYWQYQYQYKFQKRIAIPIPIYFFGIAEATPIL